VELSTKIKIKHINQATCGRSIINYKCTIHQIVSVIKLRHLTKIIDYMENIIVYGKFPVLLEQDVYRYIVTANYYLIIIVINYSTDLLFMSTRNILHNVHLNCYKLLFKFLINCHDLATNVQICIGI
jgi:hypothetical protein